LKRESKRGEKKMRTRGKGNKWGQQTFRENSDHECFHHRYSPEGRVNTSKTYFNERSGKNKYSSSEKPL